MGTNVDETLCWGRDFHPVEPDAASAPTIGMHGVDVPRPNNFRRHRQDQSPGQQRRLRGLSARPVRWRRSHAGGAVSDDERIGKPERGGDSRREASRERERPRQFDHAAMPLGDGLLGEDHLAAE